MTDTGASRIAQERLDQAARYPAEHDDAHLPGDLLGAGIAYAIHAWSKLMRDASGNPTGWTEDMTLDICLEQWWPFDADEWNPGGDPLVTLVKAGGLIAAEIDRAKRNG